MNGNVTQEGVRLDFEWMKRVGIGGVQNFDAAFDWGTAFDTPQQVENPLVYLTPEWRQAFRYSVTLADKIGLEFSIASSPGWSETGGPWVKPHEGMKKLVWSETYVDGGVPFNGRLARPPRTTGLFQNIPLAPLGLGGASERPTYYADVATIAYRVPDSEVPLAELKPVVTSSGGEIDSARLFDGDLTQTVALPFGDDPYAWIEFSFGSPQRIQALTTVFGRSLSWDPLQENDPDGWLEAKEDGCTFRKVADFPKNGSSRSGALQQTISFPPTTARVFRMVLERPEWKPGFAEELGLSSAKPPIAHQLAELVLHTAARVNRFEDKGGFAHREILEQDDTPAVAAQDAVNKGDVIDLTSQMRPDGTLDWTPPSGRWVVLRYGYSLTGRNNHPASRAGTGLEVDKLSRVHVKTYLDTYLAEYEETLGKDLIGQRGVQYMLTDSYEAGIQNWTDDVLEQFRERRGYDPLPWLPVLAGRVVESAVASDRFLWDFRQTIGDLMAEAHYGRISALLHERGLGRYGESHEFQRAFIGDGMEAKKTADIPMGATWALAPPGVPRENYDADIRESASVAHVYGNNLAAAESFTAYGNTYGFAPEDLKPIADRMMSMGVNRFVIHASVHQPDSRPGPGIGLGPFGQFFTRKETWSEQAGGWISYLTRCSYLLQQGRFVADIAYLYGEGTNVTSLFHENAPAIPEGYNFDFINSGALLNELWVKDGNLVTRSGMEYRVLVLDASTRRLSVPVLRRIRNLVHEGATVVGTKPAATPSLADNETEFLAVVGELWGDTAGVRTVGSGRIFADHPLAEALQAMQVTPDVIFTKISGTELRFVHRSLGNGDLYYVTSDSGQPQTLEASFRVSGRQPELWRADTGSMEPVSYRMEHGRTVVWLQLEANDAVFVVFRQPTSIRSLAIPEPGLKVLTTLEGPWDVTFPPDLGAPPRARFEKLYSWTESSDPGVKYFSGTATYYKTIKVRPEWLEDGARLKLDLGRVKNLAEVFVNGRALGILWKSPFKIDITGSVRSGNNRLEIKVTNLWPNRLIGDKQPRARPIAYAAYDPFEADSPLLSSGLLGPVSLIGVNLR